MKNIILFFMLVAGSCSSEEEQSEIAEWIVVSEDKTTICLKETVDSEIQCYNKVSY